MDLNDLAFYCVDCGVISDNSEIEKQKIPNGIAYKTTFICPNCGETTFSIYSKRSY